MKGRKLFTVIFLMIVSIAASKNGFFKDVEDKVHALANRERAGRGRQMLMVNEKLRRLARIHSKNMAERNFFSHGDHLGRSPQKRKMEYFPGLFGGIGENIAYTYGHSEEIVVEKLIKQWMNSPGHRRNILNGKYNATGIGVYYGRGRYYGTQVFGTLIAELDGKAPELLQYGDVLKLRFKFLGSFPKDKITVFIHFPDKRARFKTSAGLYYKGLGKIEPEWEGDYFTVTLKMKYGRGVYRLTMGSYGRFFPEGLNISVR